MIMGDEDVVWPHISVDDVVFMQILQAFCSSQSYFHPLFPTERSAAMFCKKVTK